MSMSQIGKGLKDAGTAGWAKLCLGVLVFEIAAGVVGVCALSVYLSEKQQKQQAAQAAHNVRRLAAIRGPIPMLESRLVF